MHRFSVSFCSLCHVEHMAQARSHSASSSELYNFGIANEKSTDSTTNSVNASQLHSTWLSFLLPNSINAVHNLI